MLMFLLVVWFCFLKAMIVLNNGFGSSFQNLRTTQVEVKHYSKIRGHMSVGDADVVCFSMPVHVHILVCLKSDFNYQPLINKKHFFNIENMPNMNCFKSSDLYCCFTGDQRFSLLLWSFYWAMIPVMA